MSTAIISEAIRVKFPLHSFVWDNDYRKLEKQLPQSDIEAVDPRGRTALHLAVSLGHLESVRVLLTHGAEVTKENGKNWTVMQEAVSTGDPEMVQLVLQRRDYFKASAVLGGVPELLSKIRESPDFYVEMKWEFTSWIPLISRLCPSDVCRIWKSGSSLRVDTTLLGFENTSWVRGSRSYIFRSDDTCTEMMEVNHDERVVEIQRFNILSEMKEVTLDSMQPAEQQVTERLTTPIVNTYLDTKHIAFERNKSGMWGWRTDKTEVVNGFEAKVFSVNSANVVIRTRTEHLTDTEKARIKRESKALESLLGTEVQHVPASAQGALTMEYATATNPSAITPQEYFDPEFDLKKRDIGRPIELNTRIQKFKGTLWMSEDHPLSLVEQVTPIIDLMARTSSHFARLRDFVTLKFPPGFPVKIEIPLFHHVLNARITFGNVNQCRAEKNAYTHVAAGTTPMLEGGTGEAAAPPPFQVCPSVFVAPVHYRHQEESPNTYNRDDEHLLQYAIHQSLLESCKKAPGQDVTWYDAKCDFSDATLSGQSDRSLGGASSLVSSVSTTIANPDVRLAMELSARAQEEEEKRRKQEEEELERILQLSLTEK